MLIHTSKVDDVLEILGDKIKMNIEKIVKDIHVCLDKPKFENYTCMEYEIKVEKYASDTVENLYDTVKTLKKRLKYMADGVKDIELNVEYNNYDFIFTKDSKTIAKVVVSTADVKLFDTYLTIYDYKILRIYI